MAAATAAEMVTKYNEAIQAVLLGQSYTINGRVMVRANLQTLEDGLRYWENRVAIASDQTGGIAVAGFQGPT